MNWEKKKKQPRDSTADLIKQNYQWMQRERNKRIKPKKLMTPPTDQDTHMEALKGGERSRKLIGRNKWSQTYQIQKEHPNSKHSKKDNQDELKQAYTKTNNQRVKSQRQRESTKQQEKKQIIRYKGASTR